MPIDIPTVTEIRDRIISDFESEFGQTVPILITSFFRIWGTIFGGAFFLLYKFGQQVARNLLPTTAFGDQLDHFAGLFAGVTRQLAVAFKGTATATGVNGSIIRAGTIWVSAAGVEYLTLADVTISSSTATVTIEALETGLIGALDVGSEVTLVTPLVGVDAIATIASVTNAATDRESDDSLQSRLIAEFAQRAQGGAKQDYISWAKTVSGVTRVFPYGLAGSVVNIFFVLDDDPVSRIPDGTDETNVENAIDQANRRPIGSYLLIEAPSEVSFDVTLTDFVGDLTGLETAVEAYFLAKEMYVDSNLSRQGIDLIQQFELIALAINYGSFTDLQLDVVAGDSDISGYSLVDGEMAKLGTLTA